MGLLDAAKGALPAVMHAVDTLIEDRGQYAVLAFAAEAGDYARLTTAQFPRFRSTYDDILARKVAFGSPAGVIERLTGLREELGLDGIIAELNPGGLIPLELERRSLQLLTHEVMPAFK